jgi:hypothetical protein
VIDADGEVEPDAYDRVGRWLFERLVSLFELVELAWWVVWGPPL